MLCTLIILSSGQRLLALVPRRSPELLGRLDVPHDAGRVTESRLYVTPPDGNGLVYRWFDFV